MKFCYLCNLENKTFILLFLTMRNGKEIAEEVNQMPIAMKRIDWARDTEFRKEVLYPVLRALRVELLDDVRQWILLAWDEEMSEGNAVCCDQRGDYKWDYGELNYFMERIIHLRRQRCALEAATTQKYTQKMSLEAMKDIMRQGVEVVGLPGVMIKMDLEDVPVDEPEETAEAEEARIEALEEMEREEDESMWPEALRSEQAMVYWDRLEQAGYVEGKDHRPVAGVRREALAYIADKFAEKMRIRYKWKAFVAWGMKRLDTALSDFKQDLNFKNKKSQRDLARGIEEIFKK